MRSSVYVASTRITCLRDCGGALEEAEERMLGKQIMSGKLVGRMVPLVVTVGAGSLPYSINTSRVTWLAHAVQGECFVLAAFESLEIEHRSPNGYSFS